jgi:hypothetical protein
MSLHAILRFHIVTGRVSLNAVNHAEPQASEVEYMSSRQLWQLLAGLPAWQVTRCAWRRTVLDPD